MKKFLPLLLLAILTLRYAIIFGQGASININGTPPDPSAIFDVSSTTKGNLMPRMTTAQRDSIALPAKGLEIYNTDCDNFNYNAGTPNTPNWVAANPPVDLPSPAGAISGTAQVCQGLTNISYSVSPIANAISYTWAYTGSGASFSGNTNPVNITFSNLATSGNLTVMGTNICGNGNASSAYAVTVNPSLTPPVAASNTPSLSQIIWNWNTVSGATGYKWNTTNDYNSATDIGNNTTYTETGLNCNTAYTLYVWAYNNGCNSAYDSMTQNTLMLPAPAAAANTPSQTQIVWNWNTVSGATGYKWNTTNDYNSATDVGNSTTYTQTGLTCNAAYTLYVWAYNSGCNSTYDSMSQTTSSCCNPAVTLDATNEINDNGSTNTFTINTSNSNEIVLISVNACCSGGFNGTLTVDGNSGTYITQVFGAQSSPQAWSAVYGWVIANSGTHNISVTWGSNAQGGHEVAYAASFAGASCNTIPSIAANVQYTSVQFGVNGEECTTNACITGTATITPAAANSCVFGNFWMDVYGDHGSSFTWTNAAYITSNEVDDGMDGSIGYNNYSGTSPITVSATDNGAGNNYNNGIFILLDVHP